jgi:hypothetical protein
VTQGRSSFLSCRHAAQFESDSGSAGVFGMSSGNRRAPAQQRSSGKEALWAARAAASTPWQVLLCRMTPASKIGTLCE